MRKNVVLCSLRAVAASRRYLSVYIYIYIYITYWCNRAKPHLCLILTVSYTYYSFHVTCIISMREKILFPFLFSLDGLFYLSREPLLQQQGLPFHYAILKKMSRAFLIYTLPPSSPSFSRHPCPRLVPFPQIPLLPASSNTSSSMVSSKQGAGPGKGEPKEGRRCTK